MDKTVEYLHTVAEIFRNVAYRADEMAGLYEKEHTKDDEENALKELLFSIFKAQSLCDSAKELV